MLVLRAFRTLGAFRLGALPAIFRRSGRARPGVGVPGVGAAFGLPPFIFLSFSGFPLGAGRKGSVVGGTQRAFSSRRTGAGSPGRAFALAAQKPGAGRGRWAGRRGAAGVSGRRAFPPPATPVSLWSGKKQATKRRTKKDFPSPKRRRFVKTGFFARYKEARRSGRPRGRKSPARAKATAVVGFPASPWQTPGGAVGFPASP